MLESCFHPFKEFNFPETPMSVSWQSPSNIAIVKYWGKRAGQIPSNPSLSMTLSTCLTETKVTLLPGKQGQGVKVEFFFEGSINHAFGERVRRYLDEISLFLPFLAGSSLKIESANTFPHSSGIASSASAFSALALCILSLAEKLSGVHSTDFFKTASFLSRLGSGSAARSVYGGLTLWGYTTHCPYSSDEFAVRLENIHPAFEGLRDAILIVNAGSKKVSSSAGHQKMAGHPFAEARVQQASNNTQQVLDALNNGDVESFIRITESEALTLHALMMASNPGFILLDPGTIEIITKIRDFRERTGISTGFTLDAGPNVHLIYFEKDFEQVQKLIVEDLLKKDKQNNWINDKMGKGPLRITD